MILSSSLAQKDVIGFVVFGNGAFDFRILRALCKRFNGIKKLAAPQLSGEKGFISALKTVTWLIDNIQVNWQKTSLIIIIDKEHIENPDDMKKHLVNFFTYEVKQEDSNNQYFEFEVQRGPKKTTLYIIVLGFNKRVEENISRLIKEEYGEDIPPEKQKIRDFLHRKNMRIEDLIKNSSEKALNNAFSNLMKLLRKLDYSP